MACCRVTLPGPRRKKLPIRERPHSLLVWKWPVDWARQKRLEVLRNGYLLGDVVTEKADKGGIAFRVQVKSGTDGHNVPTGFSGERLVWLDVTVARIDRHQFGRRARLRTPKQ